MSVNKRSDEKLKRAGTYVFSLLCGAAAAGILLAAFPALMYALEMPPESAGVFAFTALAAGCLVSGFVCGSIKRRGGLRCGLICAGLISAVLLAVSLITGNADGSSAAARLLTTAAGCCTGAVIGVNRAREV